MRILKNQAQKVLKEQIRLLELEIERLNSHNRGLAATSDNLLLAAIKHYSEVEEVDFYLIDIANYSLSILFPFENSFIFNKPPGELKSLDEYIHPEDKPSFLTHITALQGKASIKFQLRVITDLLAKESKPVEITIVVMPEKPEKAVLIVRDISIQTKQKKELQKTREKIEESDKLKTTILSNISHYIRTPLNSVTGFAELLANSDFESYKRREYIEIIKRQSKRILSLIDDLSEVAKLEAGNIVISKIPCNLNLVLNELVIGINHQRTVSQQEQVEIKLNIPQKAIELLTDSGRLQQTINNLVNYSLRYTQKGFIEIGYNFDATLQRLIFFVRDSSPGLNKEEQKIIFNKFVVLDNTETAKYEDPGLGLTIARNIIKNLGGRIWVESDEGSGTSFFFTIPYEPVSLVDTISYDEEINQNKTFTWPNKVILIADDEEVNAMFLDAVFQGTSVQILFARNGQEALDLCKNINKIDLILMDIKMPVMNGIKATAEIRKFNSRIPIIAQTALASEEDKQQSMRAGCNDIITKPIEVQELLVLVNKFLGE